LAQLLHNYIDKLDKLDDVIVENAENILSVIDLDELLKDPEGYLMALSDAFLEEHLPEIEKASREGEKFAKEILKRS
tara:strand:+ start:4415 stop:4645 length:231 start_codon:yes stop_codon:yes gene_type:complete